MDLDIWPKFLEQHLAAFPRAVVVAAEASVEAAAEIAREKISHYQPVVGPFPGWEPLAESTVEQKEQLGFAPPDNPLLRTGELRDSIGTSVERVRPYAGVTADVGSSSPIARYQELGTAHMPPRPFIAPALLEAEPIIHEALGAAISVAMGGEARAPETFRRAAE